MFPETLLKDILGDILVVKTNVRKGLYSSFVDHENKVITTKVHWEIEGFDKEIEDIIKDLNLEPYYD